MIVDLEQFQSIIIDGKNQKNNPQKLTIDKKSHNFFGKCYITRSGI